MKKVRNVPVFVMIAILLLIIKLSTRINYFTTGIHDRFPNQQCHRNLDILASAILDYAYDHKNRLPDRRVNIETTEYSWVSDIIPYLQNKGINPNSVLYCPDDKGRVKASSYVMPLQVYGTSLKTLEKNPFQIILRDDEPRHVTNGQPTSLRAEGIMLDSHLDRGR